MHDHILAYTWYTSMHITSINSYATFLIVDKKHSSNSKYYSTVTTVLVYVALQQQASIGEHLEHGTMDLKVAGSRPTKDKHFDNYEYLYQLHRTMQVF